MRPEGRKSDRRAAAPRLPVACALALAACQGRGHGPDPLPSNLPPPPPFTSKCESGGADIFISSPGPGPNPGTPPPNEWVLRRRFVTIDFGALEAAAMPGGMVHLELFEDVCFDMVFVHDDRSGPPDIVGWIGSIPGDPSSTVALAWHRGVLSGMIASRRASPRSYEVSPAGAPVHAIYEIDERELPPP